MLRFCRGIWLVAGAFVLASCVSGSHTENNLDLEKEGSLIKPDNSNIDSQNGSGVLVSATGIAVRPVSIKIDGSRLHIDAGCNKMMLPLLGAGKKGFVAGSHQGIKFGNGVSSLMACGDDYEDQVLALLMEVDRYRLNQNELLLSTSDGREMLFSLERN